MAAHTLSRSTHTLELIQVDEINAGLTLAVEQGRLITAEVLGLGGAIVALGVVDRAAAVVVPPQERRREVPALAGASTLRRLLATGAPMAPYLYGVFAEANGRRELPVPLHTDHLRAISGLLRLRGHLWGV